MIQEAPIETAACHHRPPPAATSSDLNLSFQTVFLIWKAFERITRDLGSFREETDKTTDLHQHFSRLCSQQLKTAS
nr:hypothetical protein [Tanacetum cinerariifolium]